MIPLNVQPMEKPYRRPNDDGAVEVYKIWYTIQGEGPFAGFPAIFIRLAGCNLQCPKCDTDYTSQREFMTPEEVGEAVHKLVPRINLPGVGPMVDACKLIVITGGEPFRQDLSSLCQLLLFRGYRVQIETNGTFMFDPNTFPFIPVTIVCSPKTPTVNHELKQHIKYLKYVLAADEVCNADGLPLRALGGFRPARPWNGFRGEIYLQPQDDDDPIKNKANLLAAKESCLKFGYRLGVQLHKFVGVE